MSRHLGHHIRNVTAVLGPHRRPHEPRRDEPGIEPVGQRPARLALADERRDLAGEEAPRVLLQHALLVRELEVHGRRLVSPAPRRVKTAPCTAAGRVPECARGDERWNESS